MKNKIVVITGASSGIGKETAYAFACKQAHVIIAARNTDKLNEVAKACLNYGAASCLAVPCDVTSASSCEKLMQTVIQQYKTIDVLINNAGISMRALFNQADIKVIEQVMQVNFWGAVYCTRYAIDALVKSKGVVISVSSIAGIRGLPGRTGYSASKFALEGFMQSLRTENKKTGLHVGVIYPGYTESNIRNTALNARGNAQQESPFDESKLMPASTVAECILNMATNRIQQQVLTTQGKLTFWLSKFVPSLVDNMIYKVVSKEKDSPFTS
ncbi:MAG: SDR family oxidoreductase [Bacteroidia bacterium]|nr:SDR family oxidoreductase [Bacteroidia bacterium]